MPKRSNPGSPGDSVGQSGEESQSSGLTTRKRRRLAKASQLDLCQELFDKIRAYRGEDGSLSETFMHLPTKRSNPDFYQAVREPIDLARIQAKIKTGEYEFVDQMAADINLIVANTKSFYPASTTEFAKAVELQEVFDRERELLQSLTITSAASTSSSADSSSIYGRRARRSAYRREDHDPEEDEAESLSIAASDDSHMAASEASTTNLTMTSQPSSVQMDNTYELLFAAIAKYTTEDGRAIAPTFTHLPSKELYPLYYAVIKEPIDLRMIAQRIASGSYNSMDELEKDFMLIARNAKTFNEPKSLIYQDAATLARILKGKRSEAEHPPLRTNRERGKRASRLNYNPRDVVEEFASMPDLPHPTVQDIPKQEAPSTSAFDLPVPDDDNDDDDDEDTRATGTSQSCTSVSSTPIKRKRGRPRRNPLPDDIKRSPSKEPLSPASTSQSSNLAAGYSSSSELPPSSSKSNTPSGSRYSGGIQRRLQKQLLMAVMEAKNDADELIATPFLLLPSKKVYPDYFEEIANPICLIDIKKRIKHSQYPSLSAVLSDLDLVFSNAQQYNVEQSGIHQDSITLQKLAHKKFEELSSSLLSPKVPNDVPEPTNLITSAMVPHCENSPQVILHSVYDQTPLRRVNRRMTEEEAVHKRLQNLFKTVYNHRADDGHYPRDTFMHLPSKEVYPDYYQVIPNPIDLTMIKQKMDEGKYKAHQEMVRDLRLMFHNARHYNEEGSGVYNDALILDRAVKKRLKSLGPYPGSVRMRSGPGRKPLGMIPPGANIQDPRSIVTLTSGISGQQSLHQQPNTIPLLQRVMLELFQAVREYEVKGRQLSNPFLRLPTRTELPAYYEFIKKPIELQVVAKQLVQMRYNDFEEFAAELFLMFDNACKFNEPDSQIYADALILHRVCLAKRAMLLSAYEQHLSILPCVAPDIGTGIRRLLTNLHNAMLTACDQDGRGLVDSLIAGDGTEATLTSVTAARLAALHRAVAAGSYRRLDRLQADWLSILKRARIGEGRDQPANAKNPGPTRQQRLDSAELARRWIRLRDEACHRSLRPSIPHNLTQTNDTGSALPAHLTLMSPAISYTEAALDRELLEEDSTHKLEVFEDEDDEEVLPPINISETILQHIEVRDKVYRIGDYVYVEPMHPNVTQCHVGRITRIIARSTGSAHKLITDPTQSVSEPSKTAEEIGTKLTDSTIEVRVALYYRPAEARPSRRRRLLAAEVFRTATGATVPASQLMGHCLVMPVSQFIHFRPKNMEERDLFVCESQFSIKSQTFIKIREWKNPLPLGVELESRPTPFVPARLSPNEPLENALEQVDQSLYVQMNYPVQRNYHSIIMEDLTESEGIQVYEQYVHDNGFLVKLGDFLYVPAAVGSSERHIVRVDKLWRSVSTNTVLFSGPWFVKPTSVEHLPTRLFFPKEVFLTSAEHATHALASATGKCYIMRPVDYAQARPTELHEQDVYLCDSKYFEDEKVIRKLKKGLKQFELSTDAYEDEFYFFPTPIQPRKEASPTLAQASPEPLSQEQLNRPASTALACAVAASAGISTSHLATPTVALSSTGLSGSGPHTSIAGSGDASSSSTVPTGDGQSASGATDSCNPILTSAQLEAAAQAFLEANIDRSGKRRKLRKPPSGYVVYAGEVRKKLLAERPDARFGEISREVGLLWRQMPISQRDIYDQKAYMIRKHMEEKEMQQKAREQEQVQLQLQQLSAAPRMNMADKPGLDLGNQTTLNMNNTPNVQPNPIVAPVPGMNQNMPPRIPVGAPPATMQFYQTATGQVIQIVHTTTTPSGVATHPPVSQSQPSGAMAHSSLGPTPYNPMSAMASACQVAPGTHQVVYQIANQQPNVMPTGPVPPSPHQPPYYQPQPQLQPQQQPQQPQPVPSQQPHQRLLVASSAPTAVAPVIGPTAHPPTVIHGAPLPSTTIPTATPTQLFLTSTGAVSTTLASGQPIMIPATSQVQPLAQQHLQPGLSVAAAPVPPHHPSQPQPTMSAAPNLTAGSNEYIPHVQPQYQLIQQQVHATHNTTSALGPAVIGQNPPFGHGQSQAQVARPPSPIFVSAPPRTTRVLHSEIYQRYINRLRKNSHTTGLSDWHNQLTAVPESTPALSANTANQLISNFFAEPKHLVHHGSVTEALWSLRDHLLEDALKIRVRCLNSMECF